jgi:hypothetical protein
VIDRGATQRRAPGSRHAPPPPARDCRRRLRAAAPPSRPLLRVHSPAAYLRPRLSPRAPMCPAAELWYGYAAGTCAHPSATDFAGHEGAINAAAAATFTVRDAATGQPALQGCSGAKYSVEARGAGGGGAGLLGCAGARRPTERRLAVPAGGPRHASARTRAHAAPPRTRPQPPATPCLLHAGVCSGRAAGNRLGGAPRLHHHQCRRV